MDCKYISQMVKVNKTTFRQTVEHAFDTEISLPDYYPDIHRILKCRVNAKVAQKNAEGGQINIDGVVCLNLIYADKDCGIRALDVQTPFNKKIDFSAEDGCHSVQVECKTDYCNCRATTERTVDVHSAISMAVNVVTCCEVAVVADVDETHVQMKRNVAPASSPSGRADKYLLINDEVSLPDKCPAIRNILRSDLDVVINDKKIVENRVVVKGEILMNVLYFGEETVDCECFKESIPFSQIVEAQGINENCTCIVKGNIISSELMPRTGMSGDMRVISASVKLLLSVDAFCENEIPYITDAYSTKYDMSLGWNDVCFEKVASSITENLKVSYNFDLPFNQDMQVVDMWCVPSISDTTSNDGSVDVKGSVQICMIMRDKQGEPSYYERTFDYNKVLNIELPEHFYIKSTVAAKSCVAISKGDLFELVCELNLCLDVVEQTSCKVVSSIQLNNEHLRRCKPSSIVVYFAHKGDSVWDVARRYNTTPQAIATTNNLKDDLITGEITLVIPSA